MKYFFQGSEMDEFARSDHIGERVEDESFIEVVDLNVSLQPFETIRVLLLSYAFIHLPKQKDCPTEKLDKQTETIWVMWTLNVLLILRTDKK